MASGASSTQQPTPALPALQTPTGTRRSRRRPAWRSPARNRCRAPLSASLPAPTAKRSTPRRSPACPTRPSWRRHSTTWASRSRTSIRATLWRSRTRSPTPWRFDRDVPRGLHRRHNHRPGRVPRLPQRPRSRSHHHWERGPTAAAWHNEYVKPMRLMCPPLSAYSFNEEKEWDREETRLAQ